MTVNKNLSIWVGSRIRYFRLERALSQEELADMCELHRTYVGSCERGERNITVKNLYRISIALDVNLSEFFKGLD